ncbi:uncharacterized protein LOC129617445 [Condylostylus longicornis]|uniref:uncharacterized protein LOC129617445 n=1 Tax=Condylostylus longicornis TaxID=2530218 RepID=UPI00244DEFA2|nr:uncharacterized protein LOC129617445 [Condylostylus longicornis]
MPMFGTIKPEDQQRYVGPFWSDRTKECRTRTLGARIRRSSYACTAPIEDSDNKTPATAPYNGERPEAAPLVLWEGCTSNGTAHKIIVDPMLTEYLRQHQRDGVQFVFDCLTGIKKLNLPPSFGNSQEVTGCLLADDMGLGKTLQSITVLWTLLNQGFQKRATVRKAIVVCPASLVKNWASELEKWLKGRCKSTPVAESSRDAVISLYESFKWNQTSKVLITSYECLRLHVGRLKDCPIDLVICDEAHRLKNDKAKIAAAIGEISTKRRLLLSGTPIQNDLEEFYSLASLCIPSALTDPTKFRKYFSNPIMIGREPSATPSEQKKAEERLNEMQKICNEFILRRTNELLAKVLPPKIVFAVFCKLTEVQEKQYHEILSSTACVKVMNASNGKQALSHIQKLMKLCNHPSLIATSSTNSCSSSPSRRGSRRIANRKLLVLAAKASSTDRFVIISNFTQTLDLIEDMLRRLGLAFFRLDGATSIKKRHALVTQFNVPNSNTFAFLLSSKAGGCGINLIGANRLVMFDPDWNPANDKQALARIWRDGQKKHCYVYRLFSTGTIEEKIFQRQLSKDSLSSMVVTDGETSGLKDCMEKEDLRELFQLNVNTLCETHDLLRCKKVECGGTEKSCKEMNEGDLLSWAHHAKGENVTEPISMQAIHSADSNAEQVVSFVMSIWIEYKEETKKESNVKERDVEEKAIEDSDVEEMGIEDNDVEMEDASQV